MQTLKALPVDLALKVWRLVYADVLAELQARLRCPDATSAIHVLKIIPKSIAGIHFDSRGFMQNDLSMPVAVISKELTVEQISIARDGDILMLIEAFGAFESIELFSYDFFGSNKTIWASATNCSSTRCLLQPFETGIPFLQLGSPLYVKVTFSGDEDTRWVLNAHFMFLHDDVRRQLGNYHFPADSVDEGVKLRHESGKSAQIFGMRDWGFSPNRMYFLK